LGRYEVEKTGEVLVVDEPITGDTPMVRAPERSGADDALHAEVRRLETELQRYRVHAQRTSKLFLSVANYAEWVRENARNEAELALRKARARVQRLEDAASELERTEYELALRQGELARLQELTDKTRARLSGFLSAGLDALSIRSDTSSELEATTQDNLEETLQRQLASTAPAAPGSAPGES